MKKIAIALAPLLAIWTVFALEVGARGPEDREKRNRGERSTNQQPVGTIKRFNPSVNSPSINRSSPAAQFSLPRGRESSGQIPSRQQRSVRPESIQPQLRFNPGNFRTERPGGASTSRERSFSRSSPYGQSPSVGTGNPRARINPRQGLNVAPSQSIHQQRGPVFRSQPTQENVRQFLRLPQQNPGPRNKPGIGRIGAAAVGGAAGGVALDHFFNRSKPPRESTTSTHMPIKGYHLNQRLTPRSAQVIRDNYKHRYPDTFSRNWVDRRPQLAGYYWQSRIWPHRPWRYWWSPASWIALSSWIAWNWGPPLYYNYGSNFYYDNYFVYLNDRRLCPASDYYDQAVRIIVQVPEVNDDVNQWMPLGVFALTQDPAGESNMVLQLAVNKDGVIQGTYYNGENDTTKPIKGMVEKQNQRAVWTFADDNGASIIMETGIYNLTLDQTGVLVHVGKSQTEQWILVRLKEPPTQNGSVD